MAPVKAINVQRLKGKKIMVNPFSAYRSQPSTVKKFIIAGVVIIVLAVLRSLHLRRSCGSLEDGAAGKSGMRPVSAPLSRSAKCLKDAVKKSESMEPFDAAGLPYTKSIPDSKNYDVCIIGAGLSGAVIAERYASVLGKTSVVMDVRKHIGGNCYDFREPFSGIMMNLYGAHLFHTNLDRVYKYITKWQAKTPWRRYDHEVVGWLNKKLLPIPVNINTVNGLFDSSIQTSEEMDEWLKSVQIPCKTPDTCKDAEEMAMSRVGKALFDMVFKTYTKKQWDKEPKELDALVTARIPVRNNYDPRYFSDRYQVLPEKGYTKWFAQVLNHKNIDLVLGLDYFKIKKSLEGRCGKTIFTGPIDGYFSNSGLGKLEYRSINFEAEILENKGFYQTHSVVNYPGPEVDFTRIVEYKHYFHQKSDYTIIVKEYSTDKGDPYYPVPNPENHKLYKKYQELAKKEEEEHKVYFVGRLASYKYFNMDAAIDNALNMFNDIEGHPKQPDIDDGKGNGDTQASTVSDSV